MGGLQSPIGLGDAMAEGGTKRFPARASVMPVAQMRMEEDRPSSTARRRSGLLVGSPPQPEHMRRRTDHGWSRL
jgi:hypothetical protein